MGGRTLEACALCAGSRDAPQTAKTRARQTSCSRLCRSDLGKDAKTEANFKLLIRPFVLWLLPFPIRNPLSGPFGASLRDRFLTLLTLCRTANREALLKQEVHGAVDRDSHNSGLLVHPSVAIQCRVLRVQVLPEVSCRPHL